MVNRDNIIRMAQEAGFMAAGHPMNPWSAHTDQIEAFAVLIAAHEREECAKIAFNARTYIQAAKDIRARGEQ